MAIITNDTLSNTQAHAMHTRRGHSQGRPTLRRIKHDHAEGPSALLQEFKQLWGNTVAQWTRDFFAFISVSWSSTLSAGNRASWAATAATLTIDKSNGTLYTPTGRQFFIWHHSNQSPAGTFQAYRFFLPVVPIDLVPPAPYTFAPTPIIATLTPPGPGQLGIDVIDPGPTVDAAWSAVTYPTRSPTRRKPTAEARKFSTLTASANPGHKDLSIAWFYTQAELNAIAIINFRIRYRDTVTHCLSLPLRDSVSVF